MSNNPMTQQQINALPPEQRQAALAMLQQDKLRMNRDYMRLTTRKRARAPQAAGGALTQAWAAGQLLTFNIPTAMNAFLEGVIIRFEGTVTPATGTSAAYAKNPSAPFSLVDNVVINYNGPHVRMRPYILRHFYMASGYQALPLPSQVIAGQSNSYVQSYLNSGQPISVGAANDWTHEYYIPLNWMHPYDARGLLPIMGGETTAQVQIQCAASALGVDPILHAIAPTTGSGHAVTVSGNFQVIAVYRDGTSIVSPTRYGLDLTGLGTAQINMDTPLALAGVGVGSVARNRITTMAQHHYIFLTVVDGVQSNKYSSWSNLQILELAMDSTGTNAFFKFGQGTNLDLREFLADIRGFAPGGFGSLGQDMDEGVVPLVVGPTYGEPLASGQNGILHMNTGVGGWNDVHYGVQFGALGGVSGISPRVEVHEFFINPAGLQIV